MLVLLRGEIDVLMGKYVGQEHTMYLKICLLAHACTYSLCVYIYINVYVYTCTY